jgi:hypothetical protein
MTFCIERQNAIKYEKEKIMDMNSSKQEITAFDNVS